MEWVKTSIGSCPVWGFGIRLYIQTKWSIAIVKCSGLMVTLGKLRYVWSFMVLTMFNTILIDPYVTPFWWGVIVTLNNIFWWMVPDNTAHKGTIERHKTNDKITHLEVHISQSIFDSKTNWPTTTRSHSIKRWADFKIYTPNVHGETCTAI